MKKYPLLIGVAFSLFHLSCRVCSTPDRYEYLLTEKQRSWIDVKDTTQMFTYSILKNGQFEIKDTVDGLIRLIRDTTIFPMECGYSKTEIASLGLRISKGDSVHTIQKFKQEGSDKDDLTVDSLEYDTLTVNGRTYEHVFKPDNYYSAKQFFAKGVGFVRIEFSNRKYELIPE